MEGTEILVELESIILNSNILQLINLLRTNDIANEAYFE